MRVSLASKRTLSIVVETERNDPCAKLTDGFETLIRGPVVAVVTLGPQWPQNSRIKDSSL
jgi:hypothetical protein